MVDKFPAGVLEAASEAWQAAMDQRKFEVALKAGIDAYLHYQAEGDQQLSMAALSLVHLAIGELIFGDRNKERAPSSSCSFCGQSGFEVQLGAGPDVFICVDCVRTFYEEVFSLKSLS